MSNAIAGINCLVYVYKPPVLHQEAKPRLKHCKYLSGEFAISGVIRIYSETGTNTGFLNNTERSVVGIYGLTKCCL